MIIKKKIRFLLILGIIAFLGMAYFSPFGKPESRYKAKTKNKITEKTSKPNLEEKHFQHKERSKTSPQKVLGFRAESIAFNNAFFDIVKISLKERDLSFYSKNDKGKRFRSLRKLRNALHKKGKELLFATNGGIFTPQINPEGLYVEQGKKISELNLKQGKGNFYMQPNAVFFINKNREAKIVRSQAFANLKDTLWQALQSGPLLLENGKINPKFSASSKSKFIRNGIGLIDQNTVVFVISQKPINFYDFANFFKTRLRCNEALYLDGYISKMYIPQLKRYDLGGTFATIIAVTL